ncbi:MAG: glycosyltransferase family 4 protein [Pseudomonadota bacterium]
MLKHMSAHHHCDIFCFGNADSASREALHALMPGVNVLDVLPLNTGRKKAFLALWNLIRFLPPSFAAFASKDYELKLNEILEHHKYDVVHYDIVNMAQFVAQGSRFASVHSPNDATSLVYFRVAKSMRWSLAKIRLLLSAFLLRRFERKTYGEIDKVHVVSKEDAQYLLELVQGIDVSAIPIAVDDALLNASVVGLRETPNHAPRIICTGNLDNPAISGGLEDFIRMAYPVILASIPDVQLVILGKNIGESFSRLCASIPSIQILSWVDDYREFMLSADVVLVPDQTGPDGAKTRTIEAMSLKLPVVGTRTAFAGIPIVNKRHGLLYDNVTECAQLIIDLLMDKKECDFLGEEAFQMVVQNFSLGVVGPRYERLYQNALSKFNSGRISDASGQRA